MDTESKFETFRRLYGRKKFRTGLTVDTGAAKFSRVILGWRGGGAFSNLFAQSLSLSVIDVVVNIATTVAVFIVLWIAKHKSFLLKQHELGIEYIL